MSGPTDPARRLEQADSVRTWTMRLAAIAFFALGVDQWIHLVGVLDGPFDRFDLMPPGLRLASATLAVLYPAAGIGLWMLAPWGAVLWAFVALIKAAMHLGFPSLFGADPAALALHALGLSLLVALRVARFRLGRRPVARKQHRSLSSKTDAAK